MLNHKYRHRNNANSRITNKGVKIAVTNMLLTSQKMEKNMSTLGEKWKTYTYIYKNKTSRDGKQCLKRKVY